MSSTIYSIEDIKKIVAPIAEHHGVSRVYLFGSYSKGKATENSDVDLCIDASDLKGLFALGGLYADLQDALHKQLDLVTVQSLQYNKDPRFVNNLKKERVVIYERQ